MSSDDPTGDALPSQAGDQMTSDKTAPEDGGERSSCGSEQFCFVYSLLPPGIWRLLHKQTIVPVESNTATLDW